MLFSWFQYISTYQELSATRVICIHWKKGNSSEQKGKGLSIHGLSLLLWQLCAGADLPCLSPRSQYHSWGMGTPSSVKSVRGQNSWVLTNCISHQTDKMYVEKLELFSKFLLTSTFIWQLWWGGEEQGRGNSRSATCRTNPGFPSSSRPGHFTPAGLGAQFAPVSEGAGEPCSCRVT